MWSGVQSAMHLGIALTYQYCGCAITGMIGLVADCCCFRVPQLLGKKLQIFVAHSKYHHTLLVACFRGSRFAFLR